MKKTLLFIVALLFLQAGHLNAQINRSDSLALVDIYNSCDGQHWFNHQNWLTSAPVSEWSGVGVSSQRVTVLHLGGQMLKGKVPSSISNLDSLVYLDLSDNQLDSTLPSSMRRLVKLQTLYIELLNLKTIPSSFKNLLNLTRLDISYNNLDSIPSFIGNLTQLDYLVISNNPLNGTLPQSIGNLLNLSSLHMNYDHLTTLPTSFSKLVNSNITSLDFEHNLFQTIPYALCQMWKNQTKTSFTLSFKNNKLTGAIPSCFKKRYAPQEELNIELNYYTFDAGEEMLTRKHIHLGYQQNMPVHQYGNKLAVYAGGTLSNNTYSWYLKDSANPSAVITGDSTFHPLVNGTYYAIIKNTVVGGRLVLASQYFDFTVSLEKHFETSAENKTAEKNNLNNIPLNIYPVPAKDKVWIDISPKQNGELTIMIYDHAGKILQQQVAACFATGKTLQSIDVSKFAAGLYQIKILLPDKTFITGKFVKQ